MLLVPAGKTVEETVFRRIGKENKVIFILKNSFYFGRSLSAGKILEIMASYSQRS